MIEKDNILRNASYLAKVLTDYLCENISDQYESNCNIIVIYNYYIKSSENVYFKCYIHDNITNSYYYIYNKIKKALEDERFNNFITVGKVPISNDYSFPLIISTNNLETLLILYKLKHSL